MNIESMAIKVLEPPAVGSSKIVCSHCHHRGHRNQTSKPCQLKKCCDYTYCGLKDKHPEYFNKLNSLKNDLRKKGKDIQELENQTKAMEDFSSNNEYHFIKNLTPRLYAVDPSYKTNKPKLMRDIRLLRSALDGRIPPVQTNDPEQLKILLRKCKQSVQNTPDAPDFFEKADTSADVERLLKNSPVKSNFPVHEVKTVTCEQKASEKFPSMTKPASKDVTESSSESDDSRRRKRKRKRKNKKSKKRKRHYSSSCSSDESVRSNLYQEMPLHSPYLPLNTAHVNAGLRFQNTYTYTQPCNFTNMYTPFPVSMPLAYQAPIRSHYPERHCAFGEKKAVDEEVLNRDPESERKHDANPWCGLNTLVNIATQFSEPAESDPKD